MSLIVSARRFAAPAALALVALSIVIPSRALAHERRTVAGYDFVVGFAAEPALEGEKNGLSLRVSKDGKPVEGVEKTLKWEITHIQSKASKSYPIRAVFNTPGSYTSDVIPTLSGQYRFRFTGTINGAAIDATFESGPGTFNNVEPVKELLFPVEPAQPRELEGAVRGAADEARAAVDAAKSARTMAMAGIGVGAAGLVVGLAGLLAARRPRA
ncbi:MAG: hypothetical protein WCI61_07620 [Chloroflexota bacterium]